ncbi:hypothetical protein JAAARDRAFT_611933 [Jaapia argillacea MUCL 33604]|uniref:Uncharacterized protein n=1 Tax=Jaapia argillacea MUCL 33604 TaxID=933084 RepID=A0A067P5F4_9AGAM|nr:hypothetical protein JAAARDRAFT_611933 [Jaapia argillacea MUCL 33604]
MTASATPSLIGHIFPYFFWAYFSGFPYIIDRWLTYDLHLSFKYLCSYFLFSMFLSDPPFCLVPSSLRRRHGV